MKKKAFPELGKLMVAIKNAGVMELAETSIAFETVKRIIDTKKDLQFEGKQYAEDTAMTAKVLSNPTNWGVSDPAWKDFCKEWNNGN